ncbi:MAG: RNA 2',3'-cyclic phosphodiesterase [Chloroflexi bacterium]|nr:RNA 2',3'-cyclic phosphodiesterase [Chloroflexota bacterium]
MSETYRLFIAIELPHSLHPTLQSTLKALQQAVPVNTVKWVQPDNMHLTLKFLGDVPTHQISVLESGLQNAIEGHAPFSLEVANLGCFPNFSRPNVIWIGLNSSSHSLRRLRDSVEHYIAPLGYPTEDRAFSPHLTLGRVKRDLAKPIIGKIGEAAQSVHVGKLGDWPCESIRLMRSDLRPEGPLYTCIAEKRLKS